MKHAWIAGSVLALLCVAALWSGLCLNRFAESVTTSLHQAQSMAERGSWDEAARVTETAERRFQEESFFLHITLRHSDLDELEADFRTVEQLLAHQERLGEYAAANARLIARLELLAESERFSFQNVL